MQTVLIVDDSMVFRSKVKSALIRAGLKVIGTAANGLEALAFLETKIPDIMILDLEMPELNGLETLEKLKARKLSIHTIVFAGNTRRGAKATFDAFSLGAVDVITKPKLEGGSTQEDVIDVIARELVPKIKQFEIRGSDRPKTVSLGQAATPKPSVDVKESERWTRKPLHSFNPSIIVIASSTGGPGILSQIVCDLPKPAAVPIIIAQHMPALFTKIFADRLQGITGWPCKEAVDGEAILAGHLYLAPGDFHLKLIKVNNEVICRLDQSERRNFVRPAADYLFESAAAIYGSSTMGFVITGMGEDGKQGAIAIKKSGGGVMIQDKDSSVVWGMPGAVHKVGAFDLMGGIAECREVLAELINRRRAA